MKKLRLINLLFLPLIFAFTPLLVSQNGAFEPAIVEAKATSEVSLEEFLSTYTSIRETQHSENRSICDTTKDEYDIIIEKFNGLSQENKRIAKETKDNIQPEYTIGQVINELVRIFYANPVNTSSSKPKLDKSTTIIIAVVVSIFGMSAISVLFILKKDEVIK